MTSPRALLEAPEFNSSGGGIVWYFDEATEEFTFDIEDCTGG